MSNGSTRNRSHRLDVLKRRDAVALYRGQGLTLHQIVGKLEQDNVLNPDTQKPYSVAVIGKDVQAIEKIWREKSVKTIDEHKDRQLCELEQLRIRAWRSNKLRYVLDAIKLETEILGTQAPRRTNLTHDIANLIKKYERDY